MAAGVYGALAQGLESGFQMGRQVDMDAERKRSTQVSEERQREADRRAAEELDLRRKTDARAEARLSAEQRAKAAKDAEAAATAGIADIEKTAAARQAANLPVDPEDAMRYGTLQAQLRAARQESLDFFSRVSTGQLQLDEASPRDLYLHMTRATGMLPEDIQKMPAHIADIQSGMETGNSGLTLKGVNGLFGPTYLRRGIGEESPHGGTITRKEIVNLVPARDADGIDHPDKVYPIVRVYTDKVGSDGQPMYYDAPLTQKGTTDPKDKIVPIDLKRAFDYMGQMGVLATAGTSPQLAGKLEQGAQEAGPEAKKYLEDLMARTKPAPKDATSQKIEAIRKYAMEQNVSFDEAAKRLQSGGVLPGGAKPLNELQLAQIKLVEARANATILKAAQGTGGGKAPPEATLSLPTRRMMAEQYLAGDRTVMQNLGRGAQGAANVVALRETIAEVAAQQGMSGPDIATRIAEFMGMNAAQRALGTRAANFGLAKSEAYEMADLVVGSSKAVSRTSFQPINRALNAYLTNTGDTEIRQFGAALNSFINAYARAVSPIGTPTVSDKDHARSMLSTADSHEQVVAIMSQLKQEMEAAGRAPGIVKGELRKGFKEGTAPPAKPAAAAGGGQFVEGKVYQDANGNKARYVGGKWVPL